MPCGVPVLNRVIAPVCIPVKYRDPTGRAYEPLPTSGAGMTQAQSNINSAYNAMIGGYITYDAYAANVKLNGGTPVADPRASNNSSPSSTTGSSNTSPSSTTSGNNTTSSPSAPATGLNGVNFGPNEGADWMRTGSGLSFEEYWGVGPYGTPLLDGTIKPSVPGGASPSSPPAAGTPGNGVGVTTTQLAGTPSGGGIKTTTTVDVMVNGNITTINNVMMISDSVWGNAVQLAIALGYSVSYDDGKIVLKKGIYTFSTNMIINEQYIAPVRWLADQAGYRDCISWWNDNGIHVLVNTDLKNAPVKVIREGNNFTITAYIEFAGNAADLFPGESAITYMDVVKYGIENYWSTPNIGASTSDDFNGNSITVKTNVIVKNSYQSYGSQKFVLFDIASITTSGTNRMYGGGSGWSVVGDKSVYLYPMYASTMDEFMRIAGHEFGHVLGISDAYVLADTFYTNEVPIEDFMRYANKTYLSPNLPYVTANDIEMMWEAYRTNTWQSFDSPKSAVIRSY